MEPTIVKVRHHIDMISSYLTPLLSLTNCHMVEFFTQNHWEKFVPPSLKHTLDNQDFNTTLEKFWKIFDPLISPDSCEFTDWVRKARSHCLTLNGDYCISAGQLQQLIKEWGGKIQPEIRVKEFMTSKKSYEVQIMAPFVASLYGACGATYCVEVGGGQGHLPVALSLGFAVPCLTVDCNDATLGAAAGRVRAIQKQWHAIAKKMNEGCEEKINSIVKGEHRFRSAYITQHTNICNLVEDSFPEYSGAGRQVLLTGLHTCGNLGPESLRIFVEQSNVGAVFNVPCCYHLLTEQVDVGLFDHFQKGYGDGHVPGEGFPMSDYLRGFNLGRNSRMLAAHSAERTAARRHLPVVSLLYRALLQVIIKEHLPDYCIPEGRLKGIGSKCQDFKDYIKMADTILKLQLFDKISDEYIANLCKNMDNYYRKIATFYLLRLSLSQVIESVILLDRLLFLLENGFQKVFLVKLFDPVLSPRCHSIVAVR